jgi:hypothetical protein
MSTVELIDDPVFDKPIEFEPLSLFEDVFNLILEHPVKALIFLIVVLIIFIVCEFADHRPQP